MISRATAVYIIMLLNFAAGLWAILSFGSIMLRAPTDLAGTWQLEAAAGTTTAHPTGTWPLHPWPGATTIEQSGRYLHIKHGDEPSIPFKMLEDRVEPQRAGRDVATVRLGGPEREWKLVGPANGDSYDLEIRAGKSFQKVRVVRTARTYAKRQSDRPASQPALKTTPAPASGHARL